MTPKVFEKCIKCTEPFFSMRQKELKCLKCLISLYIKYSTVDNRQHLKLVSAIFIEFLFFTKSWHFKNYKKYFLFYLKSSFSPRDIHFYLFSPFPHFPLSAIALVVKPRKISKLTTSSTV